MAGQRRNRSLNERFSRTITRMEMVPGRIPELLQRQSGLGLLRADERVFEAMLDGWRAQLLARGLSTDYIVASSRTVARFQEHTNDYPWKWRPVHLEEYFTDRRCAPRPASVSTLRTQAGAIRAFCRYVTEPAYGWAPFCETVFNDVPSQIVFDWNSPRHTTGDDVPPRRRSLTFAELQRLFDAADDIVDEEHAVGSKRWLPALRDSLAFKVAYAYGLRRRELTMLEYVDFGPNPHVPKYGNFGALQVRWAKGTKGSGPRRRTVLTVPEFDWVVVLLVDWLTSRGPRTVRDRGSFACDVALRACRIRGGPDTGSFIPTGPRPGRTAPRGHLARVATLLCDAPDRSWVRPTVRSGASRPPSFVYHCHLHVGLIRLQTENDPADDRPPDRPIPGAG